jgi:hypothetical protein
MKEIDLKYPFPWVAEHGVLLWRVLNSPAALGDDGGSEHDADVATRESEYFRYYIQ